jgi:hypothetical protein
VPGVRFVSLQLGARAAEVATLPSGAIFDASPQLDDFATTAALIEQLDLVITVDTAVAHLAGALGKPVWVMLPFVPDWRWMWQRSDSPWYPTMRLFRQAARGEWLPVVEAVREALAEFVAHFREEAVRPSGTSGRAGV